MKTTKIKSEEEYNEAVAFLEELGDREGFEDSAELIKRFEQISALIEEYEKVHFPIEKGDPIEIIKLKMQLMGIQQKDLIPIMGSSGIASEVLNKKRSLSKKMIRELSKLLNINQDILIMEYALQSVPRKQNILKQTFAFLKIAEFKTQSFKKQVVQRRMLFNIAEC